MNLKTIFLFFLVLLTSCSPHLYNFYQVYQVKPVEEKRIYEEDGNYCYEDENCKITYSFWTEGGNPGFIIYNKTDEILRVNLNDSFFIKNGEAHDYYLNKETNTNYTNTTGNNTINLFSAGIYNLLLYKALTGNVSSTSTSKNHGVVIKEKPIMSIPPHAYKIIAEYSIDNSRIVDCDLIQYPQEEATINYTENSTPISFGNIISYSIGNDNQIHTINNFFYVSAISNYAEPSFIIFKEREEPCENKRDINAPQQTDSVYDPYTKIGNGTMYYNKYEVTSGQQLYDDPYKFYYSTYVNGWLPTFSNQTKLETTTK